MKFFFTNNPLKRVTKKWAGFTHSGLVLSIIVFLISGLIGWQWSLSYQNQLINDKRNEVQERFNKIGSSLTSAINQRQALLTSLASFVNFRSVDELIGGDFENFASGLIANDPVIRAIQLFPKDNYELVFPLKDNQILAGRTLDDLINDVRPNVREDVQRAIQTRKITLSDPYELIQGGMGIVARLAIYQEDVFWGLTVVVLNLEPLLEIPGLVPPPTDLNIVIRNSKNQVFFGEEKVFDENPVIYQVTLPEGNWTMAAVPQQGWLAEIRTPLLFFRLSGLLISIIIGTSVYIITLKQERLRQTVHQRTSQLGESEEKLRLAVEASNIGFFDLDLGSNQMHLSSEWVKQIGYETDEIKDDIQEWINRVHPDDLRIVTDNLEACIGGFQKDFYAEFRLIHKNGNYVWFLARGLVQKDSSGNTNRLIGNQVDISRQKADQEALLASERLFRGLAESSRDYIMLYDHECRHVYENPAALKASGLTRADIIGKTHREAGFSDELSAIWEADILKVFNSGESSQRLFEWESADGNAFLDWRLTPVLDPNGEVELVLGISRDITDIKTTEQILQESEERYRSLYQNNHAVMLLINPENGAIIDANPAASEFYGWTNEELTQMTIGEINTLHKSEIQHTMDLVKNKKMKAFTHSHRKKNGQFCDVEIFSGPINFLGETYLFSIIHDISSRKRAENRVSEQLNELRRWQIVTLDRESRIIELKQEINTLLKNAGFAPRYPGTKEGDIK